MEPDEIRAEIERRRKRAIDLKLRETLWTLYDSHLRYYAEKSKNDPEMLYPDIKDTIEISGGQIQFQFRDTTYRVTCKAGPEERESHSGLRRGSIYDETRTTPLTLALGVDTELVFEFEMKKTVQYAPEWPLFNEFMGSVTRFIEGTWVTTIGELLRGIKEHEKTVRDKRQAPRVQQKLREDMKRFGL